MTDPDHQIGAGANGPRRIGIDGCRGGWVWCGRLDGRWQGGVRASLAQWPELDALDLALIDMPIGLVEHGTDERRCDREARALLGRPRASSVFRPPCRAALEAADYHEACVLNRARTGVALSRQTWGITPKIRELDRLLRGRAGLRWRLREAHPELCLWGLAGGRPMRHPKRTRQGRAERLALLGALEPDCIALLETLMGAHPRRAVAADDIIDALVLGVSAGRLLRGRVGRVPGDLELDAARLPMQLLLALG